MNIIVKNVSVVDIRFDCLMKFLEANNLEFETQPNDGKPIVSGSLPLLDEYREYVVRTGLVDRKSLQDWVLKRQ